MDKMDISPFVAVQNPNDLIAIVEKRLPKSAQIWNMLMSWSTFPTEMAFYTLFSEINDNIWIVATFFREDYGLDVTISAPPDALITEEIKQIFATSNLFNWNEPYSFFLEKNVSAMIFDISCNIKGNSTDVHPCFLFYRGINESLNLETYISDSASKTMEIKRLDEDQGVQFILNTWKFAKEKSDIAVKKIINRNPSGGVYIDGKIVCGVANIGSGLITMLYTLKEHRQKGYARTSMTFAMREFAKLGRMPCLTVECRNDPTVEFMKKCGLEITTSVDWLIHRGL